MAESTLPPLHRQNISYVIFFNYLHSNRQCSSNCKIRIDNNFINDYNVNHRGVINIFIDIGSSIISESYQQIAYF